ncbi:DNA helicase [Vibrio phage K435]
MEVFEPTSTIHTFLDNTLIGQVAREQSILCEFPLQTSTLVALGLVSHITNIAFCSQFAHYKPLPCGLYVASEQGKAASKSPLFDAIKGDADDEIGEWNKVIVKNKQLAMAEMKARKWDVDSADVPEKIMEDAAASPIELFITNSTPEALETQAGNQGGIFSVASTEKTILNVLFGDMYKDSGDKNLELCLSGFVGEKPKVLRITRKGIMTRASGAITILSQPGTVESILAASTNSGLSERFLMLIEPRITKDELKDIWATEKPKDQPFTKTLSTVLKKIVQITKDQESLEIQHRRHLRFEKRSEEFIEDYRQKCKLRTLDPDDIFSNELILGYLLKSDMQIMKLATVLHVTENLINSNKVPAVIDHRYVEMAWEVVFTLMRGIPKICEQCGLIGGDSLSELIVSYLQGKGKRDEKTIYNTVRKKEQFLAIPQSNRKQAFQDALRMGMSSGMIICSGGLDPATHKPIEMYSAIK